MNIRINKLIVKSPRKITHYHPDEYSPVEYHNMVRKGTSLWVSLEGDYNGILDYGRLVDDFLEIRRDNWTIFAGQLTEKFIDGYKVKDGFFHKGTMTLNKPVRYIYCNTKEHRLEYGKADNEEVGVFANRFMCHDLKITLPEEVDKTKLLVFTNDYVCYTVPARGDHSVFAYGAADFVTSIPHTSDIAYMDFSEVGDVHCHPLSFTSKKAKVLIRRKKDEEHQEVTPHNPWTIVFDNEYNLSEYTAFIVINHFLVLPDMYEITGDNTITLDIRKLALEQSSLAIARLKGETKDINDFCVQTDTYKLLTEQLRSTDGKDSFVILVKGQICVDRIRVNRQFRTSDTKEEGLLYDPTTGAIVSDLVAKYPDCVQHVLYHEKEEYLDKDENISYIPREKEMVVYPDYLNYKALDLIKMGGL